MYYGTYTCITELIHVFQILYMYFRAYTCLTELILVLRKLYWSYETYTGLMEIILVFQSTYLYFGSYMCILKLILEFQILFICEGTHRYDKSKQIRLMQIHILILLIQKYPWVLQNIYRGIFRSLLLFFIQCLIICLSKYLDQS